MPAIIQGIVFNDFNSNGVQNIGEPGIANVPVVIRDPGGTCTTVLTNASGIYTFPNLTVAGNYTVYETAEDPGITCPPTEFAQPAGLTGSTTTRTEIINVTQADIDNDVTITGRNYGHDNPDIFPCIAVGYQVLAIDANNSEFISINLVTGTTSVISPDIGIVSNAIGYNVLDNLIYGMQNGSTNLIRLAEDGTLTNLGPVLNLPGNAGNYIAGAVDLNGHLFIKDSGIGDIYYIVDVNQNSPTFGEVLNVGGTLLSQSLLLLDWVFNSVDGQLYTVAVGSGDVLRIDPVTGIITTLITVGVPALGYGAIYSDASGFIYVNNNGTGVIYRIAIAGNNATGEEFTTTSPSFNNDGTSCPNAFLDIDFGDAPDTAPGTGPLNYNTLLASNGPRHGVVSDLVLGTLVTSEPDAFQNATATGDDIGAGIQDDGVTFPLPVLMTTDAAYALPMTVTNNTNQDANLYVWLDFNRDGIFSENEAAAPIVVPALSGTTNVIANFVTAPLSVLGTSFIRARLTTDTLVNANNADPTLEDTRSIGPASDGEVEDYLIEIEESAELVIVKTDSPDPVIAGEVLTYTIDVTNNGPSDAQNVELTDVVPACVTNAEFSVDNGLTWNPWNGGPMNLGTILNGATVTVLIRGIVDSSCLGVITNTASVTSPTPGPGSRETTEDTTIEAIAGLVIVKTDNPDPVIAGEVLTYTIDVINNGPSDAVDVELTDIVPDCLTNPEVSTDDGITWSPWNGGPLALGTITSGTTVTVLIRGTVDSSCLGVITNTAAVTSPTQGPGNRETTEDTTVESSAELVIVKTDDPDPVVAGEVLTYTIDVTNNGPSDALDVELTDIVPACLTSPEFSTDGGATWTPWNGGPLALGTIVNGATVTVLIRGIVDPSCLDIITNTATVTSPTPGPGDRETTEETTVEAIAGLEITKTDGPNPVVAGEVLTYTIEVTNNGPSDAVNVELTDIVPDCVTNPAFSVDGGITWNPWNGGPLALGTLTPGTTVSVLIRGIVDPSCLGVITNIATVTSPTQGPGNREATEDTIVVASADLVVVKTDSPDPVIAGEVLTYTIDVTNNGPSDAVDVELTDIVPVCVTNPDFSIDGGITWNPWNGGPLALGTIAPAITVTVLIRGTIDPTCTGVIVNTARVTSPTPGPGDRESTEPTTVEAVANLIITKVANPSPTHTGGILTYTIDIVNAGPSTAVDVELVDVIPNCISDVEYSLDHITWLPWTGMLSLGDMQPLDMIAVFIRGLVEDDCAGVIINTAKVISPTPPAQAEDRETTIETPVIVLASLSITKIADVAVVSLDDIITYTVTLTNDGQTDAINVVFKDNISPATVFIEDSIIVDGVPVNNADLETGVPIGTIIPGQVVVIKYSVKVISGVCNGKITNEAFATYCQIFGDSAICTKETENATATVDARISNFKQLILNRKFELPCQKPSIEEIDDAIGEIEIDDCYVVETLQTISIEGQRLTGYKLIIHGNLKVSINYTALLPDQPLHSAHFEIPFSTFIILPIDYEQGDQIEVTSIIENTDAFQINCRNIELNILALIISKIN